MKACGSINTIEVCPSNTSVHVKYNTGYSSGEADTSRGLLKENGKYMYVGGLFWFYSWQKMKFQRSGTEERKISKFSEEWGFGTGYL